MRVRACGCLWAELLYDSDHPLSVILHALDLHSRGTSNWFEENKTIRIYQNLGKLRTRKGIHHLRAERRCIVDDEHVRRIPSLAGFASVEEALGDLLDLTRAAGSSRGEGCCCGEECKHEVVF